MSLKRQKQKIQKPHIIKKIHDEADKFGFTNFCIFVVVNDANEGLNIFFPKGNVLTDFWDNFRDEIANLSGEKVAVVIPVDLAKRRFTVSETACNNALLLLSLLVSEFVG